MKRLFFTLVLAFSLQTASAGPIWEGIKEAAKGVGWMFYMEACKLTWALFSEEALKSSFSLEIGQGVLK
jgi:hypothetical protein